MLIKGVMALSKPEFRRRLIAGLALYGLELKDLPVLLQGYPDVPKHHPARMGREGDDLGPGSGTAIVLAKALGLPDEWFETENWADLIDGASFQAHAAEIGEAARAKAAAARARKKAQKKSPEKRSPKVTRNPSG